LKKIVKYTKAKLSVQVNGLVTNKLIFIYKLILFCLSSLFIHFAFLLSLLVALSESVSSLFNELSTFLVSQ